LDVVAARTESTEMTRSMRGSARATIYPDTVMDAAIFVVPGDEDGAWVVVLVGSKIVGILSYSYTVSNVRAEGGVMGETRQRIGTYVIRHVRHLKIVLCGRKVIKGIGNK
jgi:hypothetical protein